MYFCLFGDRVIVEFWLAGHSLCYVDWAGLELTEIYLTLRVIRTKGLKVYTTIPS